MSTITKLPEALEVLEHLQPHGHKVLSAYVDTSPGRMEGQGYLFAFRDACKLIRKSLPAEEEADFETSVGLVEHYLTDEFQLRQHGQAIFAGAGLKDCLVVPLPEPTSDFMLWDTAPELAPLEETVDDDERFGVLVIDKERARLFSVRLGQIEEQLAFQDEVPGKQSTGEWFALAQTRYARHEEQHVLWHVKRAISELTQLHRRHPFDRLFIAGPDEVLPMVRHLLPRPLKSRLAEALPLELFSSDAEVLSATLQAAERAERRDELDQVVELLDSSTSRHAEVGTEATFSALRDGRVHCLLVAAEFAETGRECQDCQSITQIEGPDCPVCGGHSLQTSELRELAMGRARAQSARVEVVSGEAADRLMTVGGIGAWTRY